MVDLIHKSNPWEKTDCRRERCQFCEDEKLIGKCKSTGIVYEVECITCRKRNEEERKRKVAEVAEEEEEMNREVGEKRKRKEERKE